jgi:uncharacterized membrane protein
MLEQISDSIPWHHAHPILVNFTAGLIPTSVMSDLLGRVSGKGSLSSAAWWMLLFATLLTPATALTGWFWKQTLPSAALPADLIQIHQWLGSALAILFVIMTLWRARMYFREEIPSILYLIFAALAVGLLAIQGNLGGTMVFG